MMPLVIRIEKGSYSGQRPFNKVFGEQRPAASGLLL
jgi:hypothetical protein